MFNNDNYYKFIITAAGGGMGGWGGGLHDAPRSQTARRTTITAAASVVPRTAGGRVDSLQQAHAHASGHHRQTRENVHALVTDRRLVRLDSHCNKKKKNEHVRR